MADPVEPITLRPPGVGIVLARALRLRCPRCGRGRLFEGAFRMAERCTSCGLRYERAPGYFVGAIYVNYAVTVALGLGLVVLLDWLVGLDPDLQIVLAVAVTVLVPLVFFRYSRSLWLGLEYMVTSADESRERRRRRR
jgi:uncharacterized protein (DUF983 family)